MTLGQTLDFLRGLADIFGARGAIVLITIVLAAGLYVLYLVHAGFRELLSHIKPWLEVVFSEISLYRELPSVRLELFLHCFLLIVFLLCIATSILHAPIPWVSDLTHDTITGILVGAAVLFVLLTIVSFSVALRSP